MNVKLKAVLFIFILFIIGIFTLGPFIWMLSTSFKPAEEVYSYPPKVIPINPVLDGYKSLLHPSGSFDFAKWFINSVIVSLFTTLFSLIVATLGGYGLSRFKYRGRFAVAYILITSQVIPGSLLVVPLYIIFSNLNLLDNLLGLILGYTVFAVPFCTWAMKGIFDSIPKSLDEVAQIDGAGKMKTFMVILPLSISGLVATGLFSFIAGWNEYLFASIFVQSYGKWTLPVGLASFQGQYSTDWAALMAGSLIVTIPVIILFLVFQKYLVSGITAGAIK